MPELPVKLICFPETHHQHLDHLHQLHHFDIFFFNYSLKPQLRFKLNNVYVVIALHTLCLAQFAVHSWCTQYAWISYSAVHLYLNKQLHCTTVLASGSLASVFSTNHIPDPRLQHHRILTQPFCLAM